jgi:hypothetical protein
MSAIIDFWNFIYLNLLSPIGDAACGFWSNVVVPCWNSIVGWFSEKIPQLGSFADWCMSFFKFKYSLRVASFGIMLVIFVFVVCPIVIIKVRRGTKQKGGS